MAQIGGAHGSEVVAASLQEHRAIAAALLAGDAAAAERAVREHLGRAMAFVRAMPPEVFRRAPQASTAVREPTALVPRSLCCALLRRRLPKPAKKKS